MTGGVRAKTQTEVLHDISVTDLTPVRFIIGLLRLLTVGCFHVSESAVRFDGKSYLRYLHGMDEDNQDFKLSLRFKTFQEQGLIMSANSTKDWGALQVRLSPRLDLNG